jgi:hypothetical protein
MISTGDIKNILIRDLKMHPVFGEIPEIVKDIHSPVREGSVRERIVVVTPGNAGNGPISRSLPRVCIYVPDVEFPNPDGTKYYRPDNARLTSLENACVGAFRSAIYGKLGEVPYWYNIDTITQESDPETWSSFLNVKLKFETGNFNL